MQGVRREREREKKREREMSENGWLDVLPTEGTGCTMVVPRKRSRDPWVLLLYEEDRGQYSCLIGGKISEG